MISIDSFVDELEKIAEDAASSAEDERMKWARRGLLTSGAVLAGAGALHGGKLLANKARGALANEVRHQVRHAMGEVKKHAPDIGAQAVRGARREAADTIRRPAKKIWRTLNTDVRDLPKAVKGQPTRHKNAPFAKKVRMS